MFEKLLYRDGWYFTQEEEDAIERLTGKKLFEPEPCPCEECKDE